MRNLIILCLLLTNISFSQIMDDSVNVSCDSVKEVDLKIFMDKYIEFGYSSHDKEMRKKFDPIYFGVKSKKSKKILLNIYTTTDGVTIIELNKTYVPKNNEIYFLFENDNKRSDISTQKIFFKIGKKIKQSIKDSSFNFKTLMTFLKCSVFKNDYFPENLVIEAFNDEMQE